MKTHAPLCEYDMKDESGGAYRPCTCGLDEEKMSEAKAAPQWEIQKYWLPTEIRDEALNWVNYGIMPKSEWLRSFLICDFHSIFLFAKTSEQRTKLSDIYAWLNNSCPDECWGSLVVMYDWWAKKREARDKYLKELQDVSSVRHGDNGQVAEASSDRGCEAAEDGGTRCPTCE